MKCLGFVRHQSSSSNNYKKNLRSFVDLQKKFQIFRVFAKQVMLVFTALSDNKHFVKKSIPTSRFGGIQQDWDPWYWNFCLVSAN